MDYHEESIIRKQNRERKREAERARPVVHGALPYLGHRAKPKHERRRLAQVVRQARKRA
jgi:hypothetical protein